MIMYKYIYVKIRSFVIEIAGDCRKQAIMFVWMALIRHQQFAAISIRLLL